MAAKKDGPDILSEGSETTVVHSTCQGSVLQGRVTICTRGSTINVPSRLVFFWTEILFVLYCTCYKRSVQSLYSPGKCCTGQLYYLKKGSTINVYMQGWCFLGLRLSLYSTV